MNEKYVISPEEALTQEALRRLKDQTIPCSDEIGAEMMRIEEKAQRILAGSNESLTPLENYYLINFQVL